MTHQSISKVSVLRRIAIVLVALVMAWFSFALSISLNNWRHDPVTALRMWPGNSLAHAALADQILAEAGTRAPGREARANAIASLSSQPGNPVAARVMGVAAGFTGDRKGLAHWLDYSEHYSRRDLGVQLAQIELAVEKGRIGDTLVHYDRALRVFSPQPGLINVLVSATSESDVRSPLVAMLRRNPPWRQSYLIQLVESGHASVDTIYVMLREMQLDPRQAFDRRMLGEAAALFINQQKFLMARKLTGIGGFGVRNGGFEQSNPYPPLDWKLTEATDLSGVIEQGNRENNGNALFLEANNGASGSVAEQVLSLTPGRYMLSLVSGDGAATATEAPAVTILCEGRPDTLATMALPTGKAAIRKFRLSFAVPSSCATQRLAISTTSTEASNAMRPWIDDVLISHVR